MCSEFHLMSSSSKLVKREMALGKTLRKFLERCKETRVVSWRAWVGKLDRPCASIKKWFDEFFVKRNQFQRNFLNYRICVRISFSLSSMKIYGRFVPFRRDPNKHLSYCVASPWIWFNTSFHKSGGRTVQIAFPAVHGSNKT